MSLRILLIAVATLSCFCCCTLADVATINEAAPKDLLLPFNDLLPPLLDSELETSTTEPSTTNSPSTTTVATTTKTTQTTPSVAKSTKKSYYQQQNKSIEKQTQQETTVKPAQAQPVPFELAQDLLPPFEDPITTTEAATTTTTTTTTAAPTKKQQSKQNVALASRQHVVKIEPVTKLSAATSQQNARSSTLKKTEKNVYKPQAQQQKNVYKPQAQQHKNVYKHANVAAAETKSQSQQHAYKPQQHVAASSTDTFNVYKNYFHQTTLRPARGPLPTLTPFPRHVKDILLHKH